MRVYDQVAEYVRGFFYASILIKHGNPLFNCVSEFLAEKTKELPRQISAVARARWEGQDDDEDYEPNQRPSVVLDPRE
jgi:hypothetical protein